MARRLIGEGAEVVAVDLDDRRLGEAGDQLGEHATTVAADLSGDAGCARAVERCLDRHGRIDIVSANAGIAVPRPFLDLRERDLLDHLGVNVVGVALCAVHAARAMTKASRPGAIVLTSSINGTHVEESMTAYNVSKGALLTLVRSAAIDLAASGIRVNGVAPGVVRTRLAAPVLDDPVLYDRYLASIPAGRFGEPEDVASVVSWLASEESSYVVGQTITIDGGQTLGIRGELEAVSDTGPV